jgi:multicomponent Na+:H+ antiporter subunit G
MTLINFATIITGALGLIFMLISLIGLIRLPDFYTRLHAQGIGDTLGALLMIISMMLATSSGLMSLKLLLVFLIIVLTSPLGTNLMMIAGMNNKEYREYKKKKNAGIKNTKADNKSVSVKKTKKK